MFNVVLDSAFSPSTQECPIHQAEELGARLLVPSSFSDDISTTGEPQ